MSSNERARTRAARRARAAVLALLVVAVAAVVGGIVGVEAGSPSSTTAPRLITEHVSEPGPPLTDGVTVTDGVLPEGATVFDDGMPAVANLDPALLAALRRAAGAAVDDGVRFTVSSGWRSAEYQDQLLREAVAEHGSAEEAARWVATSDTSAHVSGDAVDLGPAAARSWLAEHGDAYGLCQIYRNEPWHYEFHPRAADSGCPRMYADPTQDPRMQP